jgi:hypothetical protein
MSGFKFDIIDNLTPNLKRKFDKLGIGGEEGGEDFKARALLGLSLLMNVLQGSANESGVPPILTGALRGSGSYFVGSKFIGDSKAQYTEGTPSTSYDGKKGDITIGFNTAYAARWHENLFTPGGKHPKAGGTFSGSGKLADVTWKYIEKHLKADGKTLLETYAQLLKSATEKQD